MGISIFAFTGLMVLVGFAAADFPCFDTLEGTKLNWRPTAEDGSFLYPTYHTPTYEDPATEAYLDCEYDPLCNGFRCSTVTGGCSVATAGNVPVKNFGDEGFEVYLTSVAEESEDYVSYLKNTNCDPGQLALSLELTIAPRFTEKVCQMGEKCFASYTVTNNADGTAVTDVAGASICKVNVDGDDLENCQPATANTDKGYLYRKVGVWDDASLTIGDWVLKIERDEATLVSEPITVSVEGWELQAAQEDSDKLTITRRFTLKACRVGEKCFVSYYITNGAGENLTKVEGAKLKICKSVGGEFVDCAAAKADKKGYVFLRIGTYEDTSATTGDWVLQIVGGENTVVSEPISVFVESLEAVVDVDDLKLTPRFTSKACNVGEDCFVSFTITNENGEILTGVRGASICKVVDGDLINCENAANEHDKGYVFRKVGVWKNTARTIGDWALKVKQNGNTIVSDSISVTVEGEARIVKRSTDLTLAPIETDLVCYATEKKCFALFTVTRTSDGKNITKVENPMVCKVEGEELTMCKRAIRNRKGKYLYRRVGVWKDRSKTVGDWVFMIDYNGETLRSAPVSATVTEEERVGEAPESPEEEEEEEEGLGLTITPRFTEKNCLSGEKCFVSFYVTDVDDVRQTKIKGASICKVDGKKLIQCQTAIGEHDKGYMYRRIGVFQDHSLTIGDWVLRIVQDGEKLVSGSISVTVDE